MNFKNDWTQRIKKVDIPPKNKNNEFLTQYQKRAIEDRKKALWRNLKKAKFFIHEVNFKQERKMRDVMK